MVGRRFTFTIIILLGFFNLSKAQTESVVLENEQLKVNINLKGAELSSLFNKKNKIEHLWQGGVDTWKWHAPILFPVVGKQNGGKYIVDNAIYKMGTHGFARKKEFDLINSTRLEASFLLESNASTLEIYPFKFKLYVNYKLVGSKLNISYKVENVDTKEIYFSIGAHPGFNLSWQPESDFEDYYLEFEKEETVDRLLSSPDKGLRNGKVHKNYLDHTRVINLTYEMFNNRAIILQNPVSNYVKIKNKNSSITLTIGIEGFPYLGIWRPSATKGRLVCVEPWYGLTDVENSNQLLKERKAIQQLEAGGEFKMHYYIEII